MSEALFVRCGDGYQPTDAAGSPWHPSLLHGGALSGLITREVTGFLADYPDFRLGRLTINLVRPGPKSLLTTRLSVARDGRKLKLLDIQVLANEKLICRAEALLQRQTPITLPDYAPRPALPPQGPEDLAETGIQEMLDAKGLDIPHGFHTRVRLREVTPWNEQGRCTTWVQIPVTVIEGESLTSLQHLGMVCDLGNGAGQLNLGDGRGTINADINLTLFSQPSSQWLCLQAEAQLGEDGVGAIHTRIFDTHQAIGHITQVIQPYSEYNS